MWDDNLETTFNAVQYECQRYVYRDAEEKLMADVEGWEVGTFYGHKVYKVGQYNSGCGSCPTTGAHSKSF